MTKQEHIDNTEQSALSYILNSVPYYYKHEKIINDFEQGLNTDLDQFSESIEYFTHHNYFHIKDTILNTLADFQISTSNAHQPLASLSGGEKRYVEMAKMMYSQSDLFLIDEPTNHMDYIGKQRFISWMQALSQSVIVVTHDRDVLKHATKILELKNKKLSVFKGNYDHYIKQNAAQTTNSVKQYSDQLNRLKEAKKKVEWGLRMRAKSKEWKTRYDHWLRDYEKLKSATVKPSFWIDQNSVESMDKKVTDSYHKFKEKNITIAIHQEKQRAAELITVKNLSLGYENPIFTNISFSLKNDDRIFIKGRNGAGKSTLVRTIIANFKQEISQAKQFEGEIKLGSALRIGEYEQEISKQYLNLPLEDAILSAYSKLGVAIENKQIKSLLAQYLFDPRLDAQQKIKTLSGGQKARFQLIKMFAAKPNLLILDEPTNHLDLPSIEELENALRDFPGGILYISHDTYFIDHMGGETIEI